MRSCPRRRKTALQPPIGRAEAVSRRALPFEQTLPNPGPRPHRGRARPLTAHPCAANTCTLWGPITGAPAPLSSPRCTSRAPRRPHCLAPRGRLRWPQLISTLVLGQALREPPHWRTPAVPTLLRLLALLLPPLVLPPPPPLLPLLPLAPLLLVLAAPSARVAEHRIRCRRSDGRGLSHRTWHKTRWPASQPALLVILTASKVQLPLQDLRRPLGWRPAWSFYSRSPSVALCPAFFHTEATMRAALPAAAAAAPVARAAVALAASAAAAAPAAPAGAHVVADLAAAPSKAQAVQQQLPCCASTSRRLTSSPSWATDQRCHLQALHLRSPARRFSRCSQVFSSHPPLCSSSSYPPFSPSFPTSPSSPSSPTSPSSPPSPSFLASPSSPCPLSCPSPSSLSCLSPFSPVPLLGWPWPCQNPPAPPCNCSPRPRRPVVELSSLASPRQAQPQPACYLA